MNIKVTPGQSRILNAICRTGHPKLAARDLNIELNSVRMALFRIKEANKIRSSLELILEWDRSHRNEHGTDRPE